jgi:hypothetical protein
LNLAARSDGVHSHVDQTLIGFVERPARDATIVDRPEVSKGHCDFPGGSRAAVSSQCQHSILAGRNDLVGLGGGPLNIACDRAEGVGGGLAENRG